MNVIVTMNSGGTYTPPNALQSMMDAAARWHAMFIQFVDRGDPLLVKLSALQGHFGGSRVLWLDGDMIVRDDCPSPFDLVPIEKVGGVQNDQGDTHNAEEINAHTLSWAESLKAMGLTEADCPFDQSAYINTGFVLSTPELHGNLFGQCIQDLKALPRETRWEQDQSIVSIACKMAECLYLLPHSFNRLGPSVVEFGTHKMGSYIHHYAPVWGFRPDKYKYLALTNWRTTNASPVDYRCTVPPGTGVLIKKVDTPAPEPVGV